jgi:hypothetical protein
MNRYAVFLNGPIGVGKSSLGLALADVLAGEFVDGDDYVDSDRPWFCSILRTSQAVVNKGLAVLKTHPFVVIGYPLGRTTWIYYKRRFSDEGVAPIFIGLRATYEGITADARGRQFTNAERERIKVMISEGYGTQPFNDFFVDTDKASLEDTLQILASKVMRAADPDGRRFSH